MSATATAPVSPQSTPGQAESRPVAEPQRRWWNTALNTLPNLAVFSLLGGVMLLGHQTGWKMPKMSELMGRAEIVADDWCSEHLVPESQCIECNPDLYPKSKPFGFCDEHGVAECVIHHPELAQVNQEPQFPKYDTIRAIGVLQRAENNSRDTLHTNRIQFTSPESVTRAGIDVDVVQERPMMEAISANGELNFDPTRVAQLSTRVPGNVAVVLKTVGDAVSPGEILALVDSAQVGQAKSQMVQAVVQLKLRRNTVDRLRSSGDAIPQKLVTEADSAFQEAEIALVSARQALANLGFDVPEKFDLADPKRLADDLRFLDIPTFVVASLPSSTKTGNLIPLRAPYGGVVVSADVVAGEVVDTSRTLFTVADPTRMWLLLNVRQEDAKYVKHGLPVKFQTDDRTQEVTGSLSWISAAVNEKTRTLQVRITVANPDGALRDKAYGTGKIILREEANAVTVPHEAVQSTPDAHFVFVRDKNYFKADAPKVFYVRQVRVGARHDKYVELLAGVLPGEVVVTRGSPVLLAQLLRSSLGAGCGCHQD